MAVVYRKSDRIKVAVDDLEIVISPLSLHQKAEVEDLASSGGAVGITKASAKAMQYAIKSISGLENPDGSSYEPVFDENGYLAEETIDDLHNIHCSAKLIAVCMSLMNNVPDKVYDFATGREIKGVEFITEKEPPRKKRRAASGK